VDEYLLFFSGWGAVRVGVAKMRNESHTVTPQKQNSTAALSEAKHTIAAAEELSSCIQLRVSC